jgi:two-component system response regulator AtoC
VKISFSAAVLLCSGDVITVNELNLKDKAARTQENRQGRYIKVYANETMKDIERKVLDFALRLHGGNRRKTAESLGISERSLQYKIKEYGL